MSSLSNRIRELRRSAGLSQEALAEKVGTTNQHIGRLESGKRRLSTDWMERIASALQCDPSDLLCRTDLVGGQTGPFRSESNASHSSYRVVAWESPEDLPEDKYVFIPRSYARLSAGTGELVFTEEQGPELAFTTRWIKERGLYRSGLILVDAKGDSMQPRIHDGDILLVNTRIDPNFEDGKIYAIRYGDELRVKRLYRRLGGWLIRSDNHELYPDEVIPPESLEHIQVLGRVVWVAGGAE